MDGKSNIDIRSNVILDQPDADIMGSTPGDLIREIADSSGCGEYRFLLDPTVRTQGVFKMTDRQWLEFTTYIRCVLCGWTCDGTCAPDPKPTPEAGHLGPAELEDPTIGIAQGVDCFQRVLDEAASSRPDPAKADLAVVSRRTTGRPEGNT